jgi:hypothetical protein
MGQETNSVLKVLQQDDWRLHFRVIYVKLCILRAVTRDWKQQANSVVNNTVYAKNIRPDPVLTDRSILTPRDVNEIGYCNV